MTEENWDVSGVDAAPLRRRQAGRLPVPLLFAPPRQRRSARPSAALKTTNADGARS